MSGKVRKYKGFIETDKKGKPHTMSKEYMKKYFAQWPNERFEVSIKKVNDHSRATERYYFAHIIPQVQEALKGCGMQYDPEQTHEFLKDNMTIMKESQLIKLKQYSRTRSLTELDQKEMQEYFEEIAQFCSENMDFVIDIG